MADALAATLTVAPTDEGLELTLSVENTGGEAVDLSFADGQRVEFVAVDTEGAEVWRWSEGRMFAMALGSESLEPGGSVAYDGDWESPPAGEYEVTGTLVATDADAAASMSVVVPDDG